MAEVLHDYYQRIDEYFRVESYGYPLDGKDSDAESADDERTNSAAEVTPATVKVLLFRTECWTSSYQSHTAWEPVRVFAADCSEREIRKAKIDVLRRKDISLSRHPGGDGGLMPASDSDWPEEEIVY